MLHQKPKVKWSSVNEANLCVWTLTLLFAAPCNHPNSRIMKSTPNLLKWNHPPLIEVKSPPTHWGEITPNSMRWNRPKFTEVKSPPTHWGEIVPTRWGEIAPNSLSEIALNSLRWNRPKIVELKSPPNSLRSNRPQLKEHKISPHSLKSPATQWAPTQGNKIAAYLRSRNRPTLRL